MKNLVNTLLKALPDFLNVSIFLIFVFILFGILGLQQYNGSMYYRCRVTETPTYFDDGRVFWEKDPTLLTRVCSPDNSGAF